VGGTRKQGDTLYKSARGSALSEEKKKNLSMKKKGGKAWEGKGNWFTRKKNHSSSETLTLEGEGRERAKGRVSNWKGRC